MRKIYPNNTNAYSRFCEDMIKSTQPGNILNHLFSKTENNSVKAAGTQWQRVTSLSTFFDKLRWEKAIYAENITFD